MAKFSSHLRLRKIDQRERERKKEPNPTMIGKDYSDYRVIIIGKRGSMKQSVLAVQSLMRSG